MLQGSREHRYGILLASQALHLGLIDENKHPEYTNLRQAGVQVRFSETPTADRPPASEIGMHSIEILKELGYNDEEISSMRDCGSIGIA